jgi:hypothetical protein
MSNRPTTGIYEYMPAQHQQFTVDCGPSATYRKYVDLCKIVANLRIKDKRLLFRLMRRFKDTNENTFFPKFGFTAGEFAVLKIITENKSALNNEDEDDDDT